MFDVVIIGGGIVGFATALKTINKCPNLKIGIVEKENIEAFHQTGNNSGVIHSGIYYKPGSLKAINCKNGYNQIIDFCIQNNIKHDICGKLIVATKYDDILGLENIYQRGIANGLQGLKKLTKEEIHEKEPHVSCLEAVYVPQTGIIDYKQVTKKLKELFINQGGTCHFNTKVLGVKKSKNLYTLSTTTSEIQTKFIINCAGLYSDKVTKMTVKTNHNIQIIPFRGEYYELKKAKEYLVKNLIYPVPNPNFPFLGVHFTRMIHGGIEAGPNAVLAFSREGYKKWDINVRELYETLVFPGFRKVAHKYWDEGWMEIKRSFSKNLFVKAMQEMIPEIQKEDVFRSGAGVRAQACDTEGGLLDDFKIIESENIINVCNAPSPAATSSLAIGDTISNLLVNKMK